MHRSFVYVHVGHEKFDNRIPVLNIRGSDICLVLVKRQRDQSDHRLHERARARDQHTRQCTTPERNGHFIQRSRLPDSSELYTAMLVGQHLLLHSSRS